MLARSALATLATIAAIQLRSSSTLLASAATTATSSATADDGCITDYDAAAGVDYFPVKAEIMYAETFSVEYFNSYKVLTITNGEESIHYVLYQCGTTQPELSNLDVKEYISIPVTTVATGTPDHIPRIELLGHRDTIVAYVGDTSRIGSPCADALVEDGTIVEARTTNATCGDIADNDMLETLGVEVTFVDSLELSYSCEDLGDVYRGVPIYAYLETGETSGLGEGEIIKLFSLFYNEEETANQLFQEIEDLWFCTINNAQGCSLQLNSVPDVAWFNYVPTNSLYSDFASGWSPPTEGVYYHYAIENAGGNMLTCNATDLYMSDEDMLACFGDATVCVFAADYAEVEAAMNSTILAEMQCVKDDRVYDFTLSGTNAWFEAKTVEPHVLIEDMVVVLHGEDFNYGIGDYERLLLRHVASEDSETGTYYQDEGTCSDTEEALTIQGECDIIVDFATCEETVGSDGESSTARTAVVSWIMTALIFCLSGAVAAGAL